MFKTQYLVLVLIISTVFLRSTYIPVCYLDSFCLLLLIYFCLLYNSHFQFFSEAYSRALDSKSISGDISEYCQSNCFNILWTSSNTKWSFLRVNKCLLKNSFVWSPAVESIAKMQVLSRIIKKATRNLPYNLPPYSDS